MDYFLAFIEIEGISLNIKFHLDRIPPYFNFIKKGTK